MTTCARARRSSHRSGIVSSLSSTPGKSITSIPLITPSRLYRNGIVVRLTAVVPTGTYMRSKSSNAQRVRIQAKNWPHWHGMHTPVKLAQNTSTCMNNVYIYLNVEEGANEEGLPRVYEPHHAHSCVLGQLLPQMVYHESPLYPAGY